MRRSSWRCAVIMALSGSVLVSTAATAQRVTQGDALAVLQALVNGGWAVSEHSEQLEGAPSDFMPDSAARIAPNAAFHGRHYCALDWHVISIALNEGNLPGESRTSWELFDALAARQVELRLNGVTLDTVRTAARRSLIPGFTEAYGLSIGQVMAPEDLAPGAHGLVAIGSRPGIPPRVVGAITFFIDAPETGACLP